jgi:outer membrane lipoprotein SlyB
MENQPMNKPRLTTLGAALLASAVLLAGCNKPADPAQTPPPPSTVPTTEVPAEPAPPPAEPVAEPEPAPAPAPKPKPKPKPTPKPSEPVSPPPPQVCYDCGTVSSITPVTQKGEAGALGTLGGAAAGGVAGHQFGGGRGKDVATVAGAVLGAMAGREIEKRARSTTVYQIGVSMEDGSSRTVTVNDPAGLQVGSRVRVDGNNLMPR